MDLHAERLFCTKRIFAQRGSSSIRHFLCLTTVAAWLSIMQGTAPVLAETAVTSTPIAILSAAGAVGADPLDSKIVECGGVELVGRSQLTAKPGKGVFAVLENHPFPGIQPIYTKEAFGDCSVTFEFLMARGSNSGIKLHGRYEIQLYDSHGKEKPTGTDCGGIYPHWKFRPTGGLNYLDEGYPPKTNACRPPGEWQTLEITFRAPRFDSDGTKTANAKFDLVLLNGIEIHRDVELDSPTGNASTPLPEVARAKLFLQTDHGAVAFRNVSVTPLE